MALIVGLSGSQPLRAKDAPASAPQLLQELETTLKAKDKAAIMALYNWEGVADWVKAAQSEDVDDWLTRELKSAKLSPLPANFSGVGEDGNIRFHINVQPAGAIELEFTDGFGISFPYGKKSDAFYLAGAITEETPALPGDTNGLIIWVETPDGKRLDHACVQSSKPGQISTLHFKRLYDGVDGDFLTDSQGQFRLPLTDTNLTLVLANANGFGCLQSSELANRAAIVVQPWGRIEGVFKNRNQIMTNAQLELAVDRDYYGVTEIPPVRLAGKEITTDANGRFFFDAVPPLKLVINRHNNLTSFSTYLCSVSAKPGETNHLEINGRGRTVTGRVILGPSLDTNLDLSSCSAALTSVANEPGRAARNINFQVSNNGAFHADLVKPGDYKISGDVRDDRGMVALIDPVLVHVPDDTSDVADVPFNVGSVTLKAAINLKPGDTAPNFSVNDLDGKSLRLSDYRGKYVLLDFWATWCGPCVGETPHMKETFDAFGKDQRFAMMSLSLDQDPAAPRKFARIHDIAWTQGFLGDWSNDKVTATYGVYAIPAIFLIGPDGKVLATHLRGAGIKEAVATALAH